MFTISNICVQFQRPVRLCGRSVLNDARLSSVPEDAPDGQVQIRGCPPGQGAHKRTSDEQPAASLTG